MAATLSIFLTSAFADDGGTRTLAAGTSYGFFNLLDSRSKYNTGFFPEPLQTDEMDGDQEFRLNFVHFEKHGMQSTEAGGEIEKSWGNLSMEFEFPYERDSINDHGDKSVDEGMASIEVSARYPVYQYVSPSGFFDFTAGARVELAVATDSEVSKDNEIVGAVYQTLALGDHFSLQANIGYSTLFGGGEDGGAQSLEYAAVLGYNLDTDWSFLPRVTPVLEIDSETGLNHGENGNSDVTGAIGSVFTFESNKYGQPKFILGYIFPLNEDAREEFHWGVTTSLIFEF